MLSSFRKDDSCFNINKYYQRKKKGESFRYDNFLLNSKQHRAMPSFLDTVKMPSYNTSLSQRDLILPILSRNSSLNDVLEDPNSHKRPMANLNHKLIEERPRLNIMKLIFEEDENNTSNNQNLMKGSLREPDIDYFLSKIAYFKPEIVQKISEAFVLDNFYDYHYRKNIEDKSTAFKKALLTKQRASSYAKYSLDNKTMELFSPKIAQKYITYQQLISGVVSHCLEVKNSSNKVLTIHNITDYFDGEVKKIKQKYEAIPQSKRNEMSEEKCLNELKERQETLMNHILPVRVRPEPKDKANFVLSHNEDNAEVTLPSMKSYHFINEPSKANEESKSKQRKRVLHHENFHGILQEITERVMKHTTTLNREISDELKRIISNKKYLNQGMSKSPMTGSKEAIEDEYNNNLLSIQKVPNSSFSLFNKIQRRMRNYLSHSRDNLFNQSKTLEEQKSRNVKQSEAFTLLEKEYNDNISKSVRNPIDSDAVKLQLENNVMPKEKEPVIIDQATNTVLSTVREMKKRMSEDIVVQEKEEIEERSQYEMVEEMVHLNTEMEFLCSVTKDKVNQELNMLSEKVNAKNKKGSSSKGLSLSQSLFLKRSFQRWYIEEIDDDCNKYLTIVNNKHDYFEKSKRITGRLRWIKPNEEIIKKKHFPIPVIKLKENKASHRISIGKKTARSPKPTTEQKKEDGNKAQLSKAKEKSKNNSKGKPKEKEGDKSPNTKRKGKKVSSKAQMPSKPQTDNSKESEEKSYQSQLKEEATPEKKKDPSTVKVTLLAKQLEKAYGKEYSPKDRFNSVNYQFQLNQMKQKVRERPESSRGLKVINHIRQKFSRKQYMNKSFSYFLKRKLVHNIEQAQKPTMTKMQMNYFQNEKKTKYSKKLTKNSSKNLMDNINLDSLSTSNLRENKQLPKIKDITNESEPATQRHSIIKPTLKNMKILQNSGVGFVLKDKSKEDESDKMKNVSNEPSQLSSQTNTVETSLSKIRAEAQKNRPKYKRSTNKYKPIAKLNRFDINSLKQDDVTPLQLYKKKDLRDEVELEKEHMDGDDIDILSMFKEISALTPEVYSKKMSEFLDLQLLRSDRTIKAKLEERLNGFRDNLAQNLSRKREYQHLIGSRIKFENQATVSMA